jgi:hypothetical protein
MSGKGQRAEGWSMERQILQLMSSRTCPVLLKGVKKRTREKDAQRAL